MALKPSIALVLPDQDQERVRRNIDERITELQKLPSAAMRVIANVQLPDATEVTISHGLGRAPVWIRESAPRSLTPTVIGSTGRVVEVRKTSTNRAQSIILKATGWGATIEVDVVCL